MTGAILALEDGSVFHGTAIGAIDLLDYTCGEVVFNTSMTGYQEIISDPSYCEQIVMFTQPHIGNVGINQYDSESNSKQKIWSKGIIVKSLATISSSWRAENSLNNYLIENKIIGIANIDTRAMTIILRTKGSLRGCIYNLKNINTLADVKNIVKKSVDLAKNYKSLENLDLAKVVSCNSIYNWQEDVYYLNNNINNKYKSNKKFNVIVYDFGVKQQILKLLINRDCNVIVVPATTDVKQVLEYNPAGILLSNGPGDPVACSYAINNTQEFIKLRLPIFGICLGFQILALALGAKTLKMKFGHHGGNHPVQNLENKKVMITSQNHGFMVDKNSFNNNIIITHQSLFDNTLQGFKHSSLPVFGFQGHPEASPGPNDIEYLFDDFVDNIIQYLTQKNVLKNQVNS